MARAPPREPARPRARGRRVRAPHLVPRERTLQAQPRHGAAPGGRARRAPRGAQRLAARGRPRPGVPPARRERGGDGRGGCGSALDGRPARSLSRLRARPALGHRAGERGGDAAPRGLRHRGGGEPARGLPLLRPPSGGRRQPRGDRRAHARPAGLAGAPLRRRFRARLGREAPGRDAGARRLPRRGGAHGCLRADPLPMGGRRAVAPVRLRPLPHGRGHRPRGAAGRADVSADDATRTALVAMAEEAPPALPASAAGLSRR